MNEKDPLTAATEESDVRYDRLRTAEVIEQCVQS